MITSLWCVTTKNFSPVCHNIVTTTKTSQNSCSRCLTAIFYFCWKFTVILTNKQTPPCITKKNIFYVLKLLYLYEYCDHTLEDMYTSEYQNRLTTYEMKENCRPLLLCVRYHCYAYPPILTVPQSHTATQKWKMSVVHSSEGARIFHNLGFGLTSWCFFLPRVYFMSQVVWGLLWQEDLLISGMGVRWFLASQNALEVMRVS